MRRLAFFSPLPPSPTGIADYSVDVLRLLAGTHTIDVFHSQEVVHPLGEGFSLHPSSEFIARHQEAAYDLAIYQMGNAPAHGFLYDCLTRVSGLLVLHDLVLHHSRAAMFLSTPEAEAYRREPSSAARRAAALVPLESYREELEYSYPGRGDALQRTHLATVGTLLPYAYPLFRIPVEASRLTAVHNSFMRAEVQGEVPDAETVLLPMPVSAAEVAPERVAALRSGYGIGGSHFVVGCFGLLTPEKEIATVARAVARAARVVPDLRLLLVGPTPDPRRLSSLLEESGVRRRTIVTGRVPLEDLPCHMEVADLAVHLRYPTARETSAALLRLLAQGRPSVASDLQNLSDIPEGALLRVDPTDEEGGVTRAILTLRERNDVREALGRQARAFARDSHSPARCREAYLEAIERAIALPGAKPRPWPSHIPR